MSTESFAEYDAFAWTYQRRWGFEYHMQLLPILRRLVLDGLPPGAAVLDLCCGDGRLSRKLSELGFAVTGVDVSAEMIHYARQRAPGVEFSVQDARQLNFTGQYDVVVSVFESLNHMMSLVDLGEVFRRVFRALRPGGQFLFDLNREPAYEKYWNLHHVIAEQDHVCALRSEYRTEEGRGECAITVFRLDDGAWRRSDTVITQKLHDVERVRDLLGEAGFMSVRLLDARNDLAMAGDVGEARTFFHAQ